ncbi:MAG: hypothetical protein HY319_14880 [Armatimonadetes bacterium]|nr:hypothetical protein [Armatimonadota bacterium]
MSSSRPQPEAGGFRRSLRDGFYVLRRAALEGATGATLGLVGGLFGAPGIGAVVGGTFALATGRCGDEQAAGLGLFGVGGLLAGCLLAPSVGWSWALVGASAAVGGAVGVLHGLAAEVDNIRTRGAERVGATVLRSRDHTAGQQRPEPGQKSRELTGASASTGRAEHP